MASHSSRRYRGEIYRSLVFPAQFTQPDPGVDFIDDRMFRPWVHFFTSPASEAPFTKAACLPTSKARLGSRSPIELDQLGHQPGPAGLMAGARARRRCRRGSTRRRGCGRASGDRSGTSPCRRRQVAARAHPRRKILVSRSAISLLTSKRFIILPEPVGHSILKLSP